MNAIADRPYRKNLISHGLIYIGGVELEITIKDISLTGVLAQLKYGNVNREVKDIFNMLSASATIDLYLPEMRLAGEAEVARIDIINDDILIAIEFKTMAYDVDNLLYKRKVYRKNMATPGKILLMGKYHDFITVNVSVEGLMISVAESIVIEQGEITVFEIEALELDGEIKVIWVEPISNVETLLGLQYIYMKRKDIKGIPRFFN